jgi:hypothetical protein
MSHHRMDDWIGCVVFPYYVVSALGLYFEKDRRTTTAVFAAGTV